MPLMTRRRRGGPRSISTETADRLGAKTLDLKVPEGTRLNFTLSLSGILVDEPVQSLTWTGRTDSVSSRLEISRRLRIWYPDRHRRCAG